MSAGSTKKEAYDLVLVLGFFRRIASYLSIIKYLSGEFRIGLFDVPQEESLKSKHKTTQEDFTRLCVELGAESVEEGPVSGRVILIPQQPYTDEAFRLMRENLRGSRRLGLMALAWGGLHEEFIEAADIQKVFVVHRALYDFLSEHRRGAYSGTRVPIQEVGLPYKKYPVFEDFETDYLLAIPTPFSFPTERNKIGFLDDVLSLLGQMEPGSHVVHKAHNAVDYDYFSPATYRRLAKSVRKLPVSFVRRCVAKGARALPGRFGEAGERLQTALLYEEIMKQVTPIEVLTRHHYCAMEAFLPGVRKGVIGGLSNTIWGTLYFKLPFFNCVDITRQDRQSSKTLYRTDPSLLLDLNLEFFNVPYCEGRLRFDEKYFEIIDEATREGDLLGALRAELESAER